MSSEEELTDLEPRLQHRWALVVQDLYSYSIQCYPTKTGTAAQGTMKSLQTLMPPDQKKKKNGTTHTDHSLEFVRACEDRCWNHDKSAPHHFETNALDEHAVSRTKKKGLRHFWFGRAFQTCRGKKQWDGPVICETYKTKWQTESHRTKQYLALRLMVQVRHSGAEIYF